MRSMLTTLVHPTASGRSLACAAICAMAATASARDEALWVRTESPRATLDSFLRLRESGEEAIARYRADPSRSSFERVLRAQGAFEELLDLRAVPTATRDEVASDTIDSLLDIFGRLELPPWRVFPMPTPLRAARRRRNGEFRAHPSR